MLNYIQGAVDTVLTIVKGEGRGDVLVFLPGMEVRAYGHTSFLQDSSRRMRHTQRWPSYGPRQR